MNCPLEPHHSAFAQAKRELDRLRLLNDAARQTLAILALENNGSGIQDNERGMHLLRKLADVLAAPSHNLNASLTSLLLSVERLIDLDTRNAPGVNEVIERQIQHLSSLVDDLIDLTKNAQPQPQPGLG